MSKGKSSTTPDASISKSPDLTLAELERFDGQPIEYFVKSQPIQPIEEMKDEPAYKTWFESNGMVKPFVLVNQIHILNARAGGYQWLLGERFSYIKENKLYLELGHQNFSDLCRTLSWSSSFIEKNIRVFDKFTYNEALHYGAKLSLLIYTPIELKDELLEAIAPMSFREASDYIRNITRPDEVSDTLQTRNQNGIHVHDQKPMRVSVNVIPVAGGQIKMDRDSLKGKRAAIVIGIPGQRNLEVWQRAVEESMPSIVRKYHKLIEAGDKE